MLLDTKYVKKKTYIAFVQLGYHSEKHPTPQFVVDIVVHEVVIQMHLWREGVRTSLRMMNDEEENDLREKGIVLRDMKVPFDLYMEAKAIRELGNATKAPPVSPSNQDGLANFDEFSAERRSSRTLRRRF